MPPCYPGSQLTKKEVCGDLKSLPEVSVPPSPRKDPAMTLQVPNGVLGMDVNSLEDINNIKD